MNTIPLLSLKNLSIGYGPKTILSALTLSVYPGEFIGLLGQNGSGKSSLLKTIMGLIAPISGEIFLQNKAQHTLSRRERAKLVALVPQNAVPPQGHTVYDVVLMGRYAHLGFLGLTSDEDHHMVSRALELTLTTPYSQRRVEELSGGEWQRVLLAIALAQNCPLLLLDELSSGLDLRHIYLLFDLLHKLTSHGFSLICAMHDYNTAAAFCTRLIGLSHGGLLFDAPNPSAFTKDNLTRLYDLPMEITQPKNSKSPLAYPQTPYPFAHPSFRHS